MKYGFASKFKIFILLLGPFTHFITFCSKRHIDELSSKQHKIKPCKKPRLAKLSNQDQNKLEKEKKTRDKNIVGFTKPNTSQTDYSIFKKYEFILGNKSTNTNRLVSLMRLLPNVIEAHFAKALECIENLLKNGATVNRKDKNGKTARDYVDQYYKSNPEKYLELKKMLQKYLVHFELFKPLPNQRHANSFILLSLLKVLPEIIETYYDKALEYIENLLKNVDSVDRKNSEGKTTREYVDLYFQSNPEKYKILKELIQKYFLNKTPKAQSIKRIKTKKPKQQIQEESINFKKFKSIAGDRQKNTETLFYLLAMLPKAKEPEFNESLGYIEDLLKYSDLNINDNYAQASREYLNHYLNAIKPITERYNQLIKLIQKYTAMKAITLTSINPTNLNAIPMTPLVTDSTSSSIEQSVPNLNLVNSTTDNSLGLLNLPQIDLVDLPDYESHINLLMDLELTQISLDNNLSAYIAGNIIRIVHELSNEIIQELKGHSSTVIYLSKLEGNLLISYSQGDLRIWDIFSGANRFANTKNFTMPITTSIEPSGIFIVGVIKDQNGIYKDDYQMVEFDEFRIDITSSSNSSSSSSSSNSLDNLSDLEVLNRMNSQK